VSLCVVIYLFFLFFSFQYFVIFFQRFLEGRSVFQLRRGKEVYGGEKYPRVWKLHKLDNEALLNGPVCLGLDHVTDSLIKGVHLLGLEVRDDRGEGAEDLVDEGHYLPSLEDDKVPLALGGDLDKGVTRHVLHTLVKLVHKLEELVHHGLEELPVKLQKAGVLSHNVHDVGRHHGLVVLSPLHLDQPEEILPRKHHKSVSDKTKKNGGERKNKTLITVTRNRFSSSSVMAPLMEPTAQQSLLRLFHDHSEPSIYPRSEIMTRLSTNVVIPVCIPVSEASRP